MENKTSNLEPKRVLISFIFKKKKKEKQKRKWLINGPKLLSNGDQIILLI